MIQKPKWVMTVNLPYPKFSSTRNDEDEFGLSKLLPAWIDKLAEKINASGIFMDEDKQEAMITLAEAKEHIEEGIDTEDFDLINEGLDDVYDVGDKLRIWIG